MDVVVCTCHDNTKTCMPRGATTKSFSTSGILLLLLGLLLLLRESSTFPQLPIHVGADFSILKMALACVEHFHGELHPCGELNNTLGVYIITHTCTIKPTMTRFFCLMFFFPVLLLLLLFCQCGGAAGAGNFKTIPYDTKQQLISYHTEGQGEDKVLPREHQSCHADYEPHQSGQKSKYSSLS